MGETRTFEHEIGRNRAHRPGLGEKCSFGHAGRTAKAQVSAPPFSTALQSRDLVHGIFSQAGTLCEIRGIHALRQLNLSQARTLRQIRCASSCLGRHTRANARDLSQARTLRPKRCASSRLERDGAKRRKRSRDLWAGKEQGQSGEGTGIGLKAKGPGLGRRLGTNESRRLKHDRD